LRIAEFTRSFLFGGTEVQLVELVRGLTVRHEVHVGCMVAEGHLVDALAALNARPKEFPLGERVLAAETPRVIGRIAGWLRKHRIDVVHVHDFSGTLVVVPAARLAGCRVIVGRLDMAHWQGPKRRAVLAALTRAADHVIANAACIREQLMREEHLPGDRVTVIRNGLDLPAYDARRKRGLLAPLPEVGSAPVITHVANMNPNPVKRQEDLLHALRLLRDGGTECHLFLVGDGARRPKLEALARQLNVADRAHFLGHRADVPAILARTRVGVLCSSAEGLSNAVIEGMAAGLPMVVTRAGGNPELVEHGERGFVVPVHAPQELATGLRVLLERREWARQLGKRARAFVEKELGLQQLIDNHERLYRVVAAGPSVTTEAVRKLHDVVALAWQRWTKYPAAA
jgi:glycosyltransferase involved in cell wall biosynthesis